MQKNSASMPVGIVIERRRIDNRWQRYAWKAVAVIPGAAEIDAWLTLREEAEWTHFHAGTKALTLYPRETEGYKYNLSARPPKLFVVLRAGDEAEDHDVEPMLVTACPYEAQAYADSSEDQVDAVLMPAEIAAWLAAYVEQHHVDEPVTKRKRQRWNPEDPRPAPRARGGGRFGR